MVRKPPSLPKLPESKKMRDRALGCRHLAAGVGDPQFAVKLNVLAEEYEASAIEADAKANSSKK